MRVERGELVWGGEWPKRQTWAASFFTNSETPPIELLPRTNLYEPQRELYPLSLTHMIWYLGEVGPNFLDPKSSVRYNTLSVSRHQRFVCWQHWTMSRLWNVKFHSSFFSHVSPMSGWQWLAQTIDRDNLKGCSHPMYAGSTFGQYWIHIRQCNVTSSAHPAVTLSMFYVALSQVSAASSTDKKRGKSATKNLSLMLHLWS